MVWHLVGRGEATSTSRQSVLLESCAHARPGDLLSLRRGDVDPQARTLPIERPIAGTDQDDPREIPSLQAAPLYQRAAEHRDAELADRMTQLPIATMINRSGTYVARRPKMIDTERVTEGGTHP
jgi:hypothetical protein